MYNYDEVDEDELTGYDMELLERLDYYISTYSHVSEVSMRRAYRNARDIARRIRWIVEVYTDEKIDLEPKKIDSKIANIINSSPGILAKQIASQLEITENLVNKRISLVLAKIGYYNKKGGKGYFPPRRANP